MSFNLPTAPSRFIKGSPLTHLYYRWKALQLPWRSKYFIGMDLKGNTFWEHKNRLNASRPRRMMEVKGGHTLVNYANTKIDPMWVQWLRTTRIEPPSIRELEGEITRQVQMIQRAAVADAKWNAKGSLIAAPGEQMQGQGIQAPVIRMKIGPGEGGNTTEMLEEQLRVVRERREGKRMEGEEFEGRKRSSKAGEDWQPGSWIAPTVVKR